MRTKLLNNFEIKNKKLFKILPIRRNGCEIANFLRSTSGLILSAVCGMEQRFLEFHWIITIVWQILTIIFSPITVKVIIN